MNKIKIINNRLNWLSAGFFLAFIFLAWLEDDKDKTTKEVKLLGDNEKASSLDEIVKYYENKDKESILDSWFLVDFADDSIISWGSEKDMTQLLNESYGGLTLVTYSNLTLKMKESISLYTNGTLSYKHTH